METFYLISPADGYKMNCCGYCEKMHSCCEEMHTIAKEPKTIVTEIKTIARPGEIICTICRAILVILVQWARGQGPV